MTPLPTAFRPQFEADLLDHIDYLERKAGDVVADRFLSAVKHSIAFLAEFPNVGTRCEFTNPRLEGLRGWPIEGFRNWLLFFRRTDAGLEFIRLLHGHRNWHSLLTDEAKDT
ncbi:MAG TPA: type II toxin-antitoxin system RelE/ParE family toxin [Planctomycetaceae bacterium]|jgi:toxin ParE1/3/4|nr:type II toxin-antitoxin system RelE/ParE family toxin [Planctomycetaceae bacterium]